MVARRAGVFGSPIGHSLSPVIHTAGYAAAGLTDWTYTAHECDEAGLPARVAGLGPEWAGLSLTMPLKERALEVAGQAAPTAAMVGAANTLIRQPGGWLADNTDGPGMVDALAAVGLVSAHRVAVLGAGGTARAALFAAAQLGAAVVTVYARRPAAAGELSEVAKRLGLNLAVRLWSDAGDAGLADVVLSTVPWGVADRLDPQWAPGGVLLDVLHDPWPTPLARSAASAGWRVVSGLDLLLAQAVRQFVRFTGVPAPVPAMRSALLSAVADRGR